MNFYEISRQNFDEWVLMGVALWPHHTKKEITKEFRKQLKEEKYKTFICINDTSQSIAFINLSLRIDHVEGASSSPIGYVEGIYVKPGYRKQGVAKELIKVAEKWAKKRGCKELGSDTELSNVDSQKFHKKLGFKKADTIVHFIKKIK